MMTPPGPENNFSHKHVFYVFLMGSARKTGSKLPPGDFPPQERLNTYSNLKAKRRNPKPLKNVEVSVGGGRAIDIMVSAFKTVAKRRVQSIERRV